MKIWKVSKIVILSIALSCLLYSGYRIVDYIYDGNKQDKLKNNLKELIQIEEVDIASAPEIQDDINTEDEAKAPIVPVSQKQYEKLLGINSESIGWITIENTNIDYPVLQATDNDYYLNHDINNDKSFRGSIFMDWKNKEDDLHVVIYGHNMKDDSMFGDLKNYRKQEFYNTNSVIELNLKGQSTKWQIFSVHYSDNTLFCTAFADSTDFYEYMSQLEEKSLYDTGIKLDETDKVLTLSTCSKVFNNARFVVHARQVE